MSLIGNLTWGFCVLAVIFLCFARQATLTQTDMAKALFISQRTYSYYESGGHNIPIEILVKIADYFGVSVDYLLNRTNKKEVNK